MFNPFKKPSRQKDFKMVRVFLADHLNQLLFAKNRIPTDVFDVSVFFIIEAIQLFDSIDILTRKQHFRACLPIARMIMEISINFQYIYKQDEELRAKNFKLDSVWEMKRKGNGVANESSDNPAFQEYMSKIDAELEGYKKKKKTIFDKAQEINMESSYVSTYKRLSEYVHSGYRAARDFDKEGPYNDFLKRVVFADTVLFILMGLKSMSEKYDLDGGIMVIDDPGYKGTIFFATNTKSEEPELQAK